MKKLLLLFLIPLTVLADDTLTYDFNGKHYLRGSAEEVETKDNVLVFKATGKPVSEQKNEVQQTTSTSSGKPVCVT